MSEVLPPEADLDTLAASLHADASDSTVFFRVLCAKLADALPEHALVECDRALLRKNRLARKVTVRFGDDTFDADLQHGDVLCRHVHSVTGVGGGMPYTKQLSIDDWLRAIIERMSTEAQVRAGAATALGSLVR